MDSTHVRRMSIFGTFVGAWIPSPVFLGTDKGALTGVMSTTCLLHREDYAPTLRVTLCFFLPVSCCGMSRSQSIEH